MRAKKSDLTVEVLRNHTVLKFPSDNFPKQCLGSAQILKTAGGSLSPLEWLPDMLC